MSETGATPAAAGHGMKERFLETFARENATTARVLAAFPDEKLDWRPHERSKTARELAWIFVREQGLLAKALTTGLDWSKPGGPMAGSPPPPDSTAAIVEALEREHQKLLEILRGLPADGLEGTVQFPVAPKTMGDVPKSEFIWNILHDHIHHRGQFSIYLRLAGGKVPSIYGPTADEPWM